MTEKTRLEFIVIKRSLAKVIAGHISAFAFVVGLVGIGVYVGSTAMQWAGFAMAVLIGLAMPRTKRLTRIDLEEIVNRELTYFDGFRTEQGFAIDRFPPVVERKTDISILTALLAPSKIEELA